jgi:hypothetical protein
MDMSKLTETLQQTLGGTLLVCWEPWESSFWDGLWLWP